jgi:hypothetical protein
MNASNMERVSFPAISLQARSLDIPTNDHPNRMPFSGVLTRIDEPSDAAPEGSGGKRIMLTMAAAQGALDSLLEGVNFNLEGHSPREKVGVIYGSEIVGNEIRISGIIYAADFPEIAATIKANKHNLGLSFEARDLFTPDPNADPVHISDLSFTGAAILLKNAAAYKTTSIFASNDSHKESSEMSTIQKMSAAERVKLADSIEAAAPHMTEAEIKSLLRTLTAALGNDTIQASKADERRTSVLNNIMTARRDAQKTMTHIDGALRRAAMPRFEEIALKPVHEIQAVLASAKKTMTNYDFIVVKDAFWRLAIAA